MLSKFLIAVYVLAFSFFAVQNSLPVTVQFGEMIIESVPLYVVVLGVLIIGILIVWTVRKAGMISAPSTDARLAPGTGNRTVDVGAIESRSL